MILGIPTQVARANPAPGVDAHPSTGTYIATLGGTASWDGANTTTITAPNGSIFDWQNFDIGSNQSVVHVQTNSTDAVLHRINVTAGYGDTFATGINGDLSAPGYLFVVNPMGIVIGADALISANRFVASGLNISNFSDYINGVTNELQFDGYSTGTLGVVNYSDNVNATELVALIGKTVLNNGTITSGSVVLAAGDRVYLSVTGSGSNLAVDVTDLTTPTPADNKVDNSGTINAADNLLLAAGDIYSNAISGVANLAAKANRDIIINDDIQAGEIAMEAGRDMSLGGVVEAGGTGDVSLTTTTGDVTVADVRALDNQITINSGGAILEYGSDPDTDLTASTLSLTAGTGITGQSPIETSATNITASTASGDIDIDNTNGSATTAALSVTAGTGTILFSQDGDGSLDVTSATTVDGSIGIDVDNANLTAGTVTAGGGDVDDNVSLTTATSGDVIVDNITAAGNTITINSAGAIDNEGTVDGTANAVGSVIDLTANSGGIGQSTTLELTASSELIAGTTADGSNININSIGDLPVGLVDAGTGDVTVNSTGNIMGVTDDDVADVAGSTINLTAAADGIGNALDVTALTALNADATADNSNINIDSIGDLPVGLVNAGTGNVTLDSTEAINDASDDTDVDVVSNMLTLSADDEIGGNPTAGKATDRLGAIETTVASLDAQSNVSGDIVIVETDDVDLYDVIATSGSIYLEATQGGMTHVDGTIEAGSSTLTLVQQDDLDLAGFIFANQANTDLMVEITEGGFTTVDTANGGNDDNAADQWQSIQAIATDNIVLQGSDADEDIKIGTHAGFEPLNHPFGGVVESSEGGVSIVSENKTVRTAGDTILDNVSIAGTSDDELDVGVDLPYGPGKAAIVIMGAENLNLGENTTLTATGTYDTTGDVDDREGVGFLDIRDEIPYGFPRYEGDPFDAAIYLASTDEDVDVSSPVTINMFDPDTEQYVSQGAMVIDAYDTVTFDESGTSSAFEDSLKNGMVGDRLEVASRITEWLFQAVGHLPYPSYPYDGAGPFPTGYTYVLRGAGLDNPAITDGRAWVLVDPDNAPLDEEEGEKAQQQILGLDGCPILIGLVSAELGIPEETIEVSLENSYALNTDVQPCESCARLIDAAAILRDEDGSRMAAMNQVFNALAPADAPLTPEVTASIVSTFAGHVNDGTQYATAIEYIDAFVQYIAVLNNDIGSPVGDSVAYVIEKYGKGVTENENNNVAAFLAGRLENGEILGN